MPTFTAFQQNSPFRPPHWRWQRARWLVEHQRYFCRRRDDADTGRAVRYLRAWTPCRGATANNAAQTDDAELRQARALFEEGGPVKLQVEARVIAKQDTSEITRHTSVPPAVVHAHESVFFDCRDKLDARDWVATHVINAGVYNTVPPRAAVALKVFAYDSGSLVLEAVIPYLLGGQDPFEPVSDVSSLEDRKEQSLRLAVVAHLLPDDLGTQQKLARIVLLLNDADRQAADTGALAAPLAHHLDSRVVAELLDAQSLSAKQPKKALAGETQAEGAGIDAGHRD